MKVIAINGSKRVIKGNEYEILYLYNSGRRGHLALEEVTGSFNVDSFRKLDGSEIDKIDIPRITTRRMTLSELEVGDILVCTSHNIALARGGFYKIEKKNTNNDTVKLEGIDRAYKYYNFRKASTQEGREINLEKVINKNDVLIKTKKLRKIDYFENIELELMKVISMSILDVNRHKLDITDWAITMSAKKLGLLREDFNELKEMKLKDILSLIDKTKE